MKENVFLDVFEIHKDSLLYIDIPYLHKDGKYWQKPLDFIPERFIPTSPYYKTPSG